VASVFGLLAVVALLITGFVAPGFFLSSGPDDVAKSAVAAINKKDSGAFKSTLCDPSKFGEVDPGQVVNADVSARLAGFATEESGSRATAPIEITTNGNTSTITLVLAKRSGDWCIGDVEISGATVADAKPAAPSVSGSSTTTRAAAENEDGVRLIENLVSGLNKKDSSTTKALLCTEVKSELSALVDMYVSDGVNLSVMPVYGRSEDTAGLVIRTIGGGRKGYVSSGKASARLQGSSWCIASFYVERY